MVKPLTRSILRWGKIVLGFVLLLCGVVAGFLPIIQGWVLVLGGLALLSSEFVWAKRIEDWVKTKFRNAVAKISRKKQTTDSNKGG